MQVERRFEQVNRRPHPDIAGQAKIHRDILHSVA